MLCIAANKKSEENTRKSEVRKRFQEEISDIKGEKERMQENVKAFHKAVNELVEKAKHLSQLTLFA